MPYYRRNLYILSTTIFLAAVSWNQVVPFLPRFLKEIGAGHDVLRWSGIIFSVQAVASIITQPMWGKIGDRYGRKPMIIRAGIFLTCIYFGMSFCQTPLQLAVFRFLNGALTGFIPGSMTLIATNTPEEHAPRSVATSQAAANAGLIVGPAIGGLLAHLVGYRGSMRVSGAAVLLSTIAVWLLVKEHNKVSKIDKTSLIDDFATSVRSPVMLSLMFAVLIQAVFGSSITPILTLYLAQLDGQMPDWLVGVIFSLPALAFLLTAHFWTSFGERKGFEKGILIGLIGGALGAMALAVARNMWAFASLYFIVGLWLAAISPSTAALTCRRVDESFRGRAYGMQQSSSTMGAFLAPLAATHLAKVCGMHTIFVFVGVVFLLGSLVFYLMVRRWQEH